MNSDRTNNYSRKIPENYSMVNRSHDTKAFVSLPSENTRRPRDYSQDTYETDGKSYWDTEDVVDLSSTVSGKYENFDALDMIRDESEYQPLDDYLFQMNPKVSTRFNRTENRFQQDSKSERSMDPLKERSIDPFKERSTDPFEKRSTKMQVQLIDNRPNETFASTTETSPIGTVSVKCTPSSPEIVGTPSQVVIKLNETIQRYIPQRNGILQHEINQEVDVVEKDDVESSTVQEPEDLEEEEDEQDDYWCPGELNLNVNSCESPEGKYCPGTRDLLSGKKVPCSKARVLREIALGRRIPRTYLPPREPDEEYEDDEELSIMDDLQELAEYLEKVAEEEDEDDDEDCCCAKGGEGRRGSQAKTRKPDFRTARKKPCCAPRRTGNKTNKCVSFAK